MSVFNGHIFIGLIGAILADTALLSYGALTTLDKRIEVDDRKEERIKFYGTVLPFIQSVIIGVFVLMLMPALLSKGDFTPISMVNELAGRVILGILTGFLIVYLFCSFLGIRNTVFTPGIYTCFVGLGMIVILVPEFDVFTLKGEAVTFNNIQPPPFFTTGYILIGLVLFFSLISVSTILPFIHSNDPRVPVKDSRITSSLGLMISFIRGLIPVLMFAKCIALSTKVL